VLGNDLPKEKINEILSVLDIQFKTISADELELKVPPFRVDVQRESDVIEEILRIYGYNNIELPSQLNSTIVYSDKVPAEKLQTTISDLLTSAGFNEILCNSLSKPEYSASFEQFNPNGNVELLNPLSNDLSILRRSLIFGGLESVLRNQNMKNGNLKFYEFGKIYWKNTEGNYQEEKRLSLILSGNLQDDQWNSKSQKSDFFALKSYLQFLFSRLGISSLKLKASENPLFSDAVAVYSKKTLLGEYGKVSASVLKNMGIKQDVFYADLQWNVLLELARNNKIKYSELPKFHPVKRDLSLLLDNAIDYKQLETLAFETEREFLKEVELFDVYQGKNVADGKKSYALSFILESKEETLKDAQIEKTMSKLIGSFESKLGAKLR
jgi:phenylalanyl-tRNA synthetase beta chain